MSTIDLVDLELRELLEQQPKLRLTSEKLQKSRTFILKNVKSTKETDSPDLSVSEIFVDSIFDAPPIRILAYVPTKSRRLLPTILHVHGGGFVMGVPEMKDSENRELASQLECAIFSVDYRLAPESPYPSALQDVFSVLIWLHSNARKLGLDGERIGLKGESGGGGIAAAVALYSRDMQGPPIAFQHLIYPMIDDRTAVRQDLHPYVGEFVWTQEHNLFGWQALLGRTPGSDGVSPYAAAARASDLSGLPPTFIAVGGLDLFFEENMFYANRLSRAGVPVEFHLYPGAYHGFQVATKARISKQATRDSYDALRRFLLG